MCLMIQSLYKEVDMPRKHPSQETLKAHLTKKLAAVKVQEVSAHLAECHRCNLAHALLGFFLTPPPVNLDGIDVGTRLHAIRFPVAYRPGWWWCPPRY